MLSQAPQEILICVWDCDTAPSGRVPLRLAGLADNLTTAIETILGCVEPCVDAAATAWATLVALPMQEG